MSQEPLFEQEVCWSKRGRKLIEGILEMGLALVIGVPGALLMLAPLVWWVGAIMVVIGVSTGICGFFLALEQVKH